MLSETTDLRDKLEKNTQYFRQKMTGAGFDIKPGVHPIVPVMLYDASWPSSLLPKCLMKVFMLSGFIIRWCRRARRV